MSPSNIRTFNEPGSKIWQRYLDQADQDDKALVDGWREDMSSLLLFAALFSASVTAFVIESYKNLKADTGDISVNILLQISRQLANGTQAGAAVLPPPFQPAPSDVAVNICWFLSLAFSLVCSLAAVMVIQWARHYLTVPRSLPTTKDRARMRAYLYESVGFWQMEIVVDTIPALIHISLFLFFAGLLLFLHPVNYQVALTILCFCAVGVVGYIFLTITPVICPGCPYRTPFSAFLVPVIEFAGKSTVVATTALIAAFSLITALLTIVLSRVIRPFSYRTAKAGHDWGRSILEELHLLPVILKPGEDLSSFGRSKLTRVFASVTWVWLIKFQVKKRRCDYATNRPAKKDSDALKRTVDFSRLETNPITIMEVVPDYIRSVAERYSDDTTFLTGEVYNAQSVMMEIGIDQYLNRFLPSCIKDRKLTASESMVFSWLEAVNWRSRCPAMFWDPEKDPKLVDDKSPPSVHFQLHIKQDHNVTPWHAIFPANERYVLLFRCTISRLVLSHIYQAEKHLKQYLEPLENNDSSAVQKQAPFKQVGDLLQSASAFAHLLRSEKGMEDAHDKISSLSRARLHTETLKRLGEFRQQCALWIVGRFTPEALLEHIVLDNLCDAVTHLETFPKSTNQTGVSVFQFLDFIQKEQEPPALLRAIYGRVLWDEGSLIGEDESSFSSRLEFQSLFFKRVQVKEGPYDPSIHEIQISFEDFRDVLPQLAAISELDDQSEAYRLDRQADIICDILRRRLRGVDDPNGGNMNQEVNTTQVRESKKRVAVHVGEEDLASAQTVLEKSSMSGLHKLLYSTAAKFTFGDLDDFILRAFRIFKKSIYATVPHCMVVFNGLLDFAESLEQSPRSTTSTQRQLFMFRLMDMAQVLLHGKLVDGTLDLNERLKQVYVHSLWGSDVGRDISERPNLHSDFFNRVRVWQGTSDNELPNTPAASDVWISFEDYCNVLKGLNSGLEDASGTSLDHGNAYADAICCILQARRPDSGNRGDGPAGPADEDHVSVEQSLLGRSTIEGLQGLIGDTARKFGYASSFAEYPMAVYAQRREDAREEIWYQRAIFKAFGRSVLGYLDELKVRSATSAGRIRDYNRDFVAQISGAAASLV